MIDLQVISPNKYKVLLKNGFNIKYGFHETHFGTCLLGLFNKRVCFLSFVDGPDSSALHELTHDWQGADLKEDYELISSVAPQIFLDKAPSLGVILKGTHFQKLVWETLMKVPVGATVTYSELALMAGKPEAVRATASAVARNSVSYLVPCHRVVGKNNVIKYRWGGEQKVKILKYEKSMP